MKYKPKMFFDGADKINESRRGNNPFPGTVLKPTPPKYEA
jgi:hypothetical protein